MKRFYALTNLLVIVALIIWNYAANALNRQDDAFVLQMGPWLIFANLANACWVWVWLNEHTGLSVLCMIAVLVSLIMVILRLNMERWDAPIRIIAWVWWPICLYSGWI